MESTEEYKEPLTIHTTEIVSERLSLRFPRTKAEEELVVELTFNAAHTTDAEGRNFTDGMTWEPPTDIAETYDFMKKTKEGWGKDAYNFAIWLPGNKPIGRNVIRLEEPDVWTIGYWMHPDFQGKGYMQEATKALVSFGFNTLHATKVTAKAMHWNIASQTVLQKSGLKKVETPEPIFYEKNGELVEEYLYEIERKNFI